MDHLPKIMDDIKASGNKPNVITYSTMLKGHCQNGNIQGAFKILEQMRSDDQLKPDEITYNSLLDGCAQNNLFDEGLKLLDQMQREGVHPSNFTLSILVKLMNRARRLDRAFSIVEEISTKYKFTPNVHVYGNLVQACCSNQQIPRGLNVLEEMVHKRVTPDSRTYTILIRSSISRGMFDQAAGLIRGAMGLSDALPFLQQRCAVCYNLDSAVVNETLTTLADRGQGQNLAVPLLSAIRHEAPKICIHAATQRKVMSPCLQSDCSKGTGKGAASHPWRTR